MCGPLAVAVGSGGDGAARRLALFVGGKAAGYAVIGAAFFGRRAARPSPAESPAAMPIVAGALAALLPCGLLYAMVAQAVATGSTVVGAAVMIVFGAGTAPALFGAGWAARGLTLRHRRAGEIVAAVAVVVMGVIAIGRGVAVLSAEDPVEPSCAHHASIAARWGFYAPPVMAVPAQKGPIL